MQSADKYISKLGHTFKNGTFEFQNSHDFIRGRVHPGTWSRYVWLVRDKIFGGAHMPLSIDGGAHARVSKVSSQWGEEAVD